MSGDIEGIGAAVTAGLAAHAVEPAHGGAAHRDRGLRCLNCGTSLVGSHCHHCGQRAAVHRSFGAIGHDLVHAVFHFEGKIWNTLPLLTWRPGELTRRFIHGERARFVSPLALFLFAVFLTYAVLAMVGAGTNSANGLDLAETAAEQTRVNAVRSSLQAEIGKIDAQLISRDLTAKKRSEMARERDNLMTSARYLGLIDTKSVAAKIADRGENDFTVADIKTGVPFIDHGLEKANSNPGLMLYKVQANAYKFAWALIPLSMPFLWLLFPFSRRFHLYDHFVFITYSISFMLLLFVFVRLMNFTIFGEVLTAIAMPFVPIHMYRQLRGAYRSSRWGAALRAILLLVFCLVVVILFMLLLLALGAMG